MARRKKVSEVRDSTVSCYYCDKPVPENAMRCPHCGKIYSVAKKMLAFVIVIVLVSAGTGYLMMEYLGTDNQNPYYDEYGNYIDPSGNAKIIKVQLEPDKAPITTQNFIDLANLGKYTNVPFHRIIDDFMIQGGDFTNFDGTGGHAAKYHEGYGNPNDENTWVIPDEFHPDLTHERGAISMANAGPNTGGSQFFIVQAEGGAHHLDNKHSVFGRVIQGMDIVDEIAGVETDSNDRPLSPVTIKSITISGSIATITVDY